MRSQGCGIDDNSLSKEAETARGIANQAANDRTLADERARHSRLALGCGRRGAGWRAGGLSGWRGCGINCRTFRSRSSHQEKEKVAAGFASLEREIDARKKHIDAALSGARRDAEQAASGRRVCARTSDDGKDRPRGGTRAARRIAKTARRRESGRGRGADSRRRRRSHDALPVPDRVVTDDEVSAAQNAAASMRSISTESSARSSGRMALWNKLAARLPASGCATRPRLSIWRRGRKGKSRRSTRPGNSCSNR